MKKVATVFASIALIAGASIAAPTAASAAGAKPLVDACKSATEAGFFDSVGACVGRFRSQAPRTCKALQDIPGAYDFFGFRNRGDCVSFIRELQNS